jgi:hypothetical protein
MNDKPTGASLNAAERSVLSRINKDSNARGALRSLEESGCERKILIRFLTQAILSRFLREERFTKGQPTPWGLSPSAIRGLPRAMRNLAAQLAVLHGSALGKLDWLRNWLKEHPANERLPLEPSGGHDFMIGVFESLPVVLKWYADYLDAWRRYGKKHRSYVLRIAEEGMESALSSYVKNQTGGPHWEDLSALLTSAYDSVTQGETLRGKKKAGDSSVHYAVENLRKRVARILEEAKESTARGPDDHVRPDKSATKKTPRKSGTHAR